MDKKFVYFVCMVTLALFAVEFAPRLASGGGSADTLLVQYHGGERMGIIQAPGEIIATPVVKLKGGDLTVDYAVRLQDGEKQTISLSFDRAVDPTAYRGQQEFVQWKSLNGILFEDPTRPVPLEIPLR